MAFTTQVFLFLFFPVIILAYYTAIALERVSPKLKTIRLSDVVLIAISFVFYMWACFDDVVTFALYIVFVYRAGALISFVRKSRLGITLGCEGEGCVSAFLPIRKVVTGVAIIALVGILIHFKYQNLLIQVWNFLLNDNVQNKSVSAILGISFITFSAVSYLVDISSGKASAGNFIDCALYLSVFAKVVSGPIVLWRDFAWQVRDRTITLKNISDGVTRIMIGFSKKLILADTFGKCISDVAGIAIDTPTAWGISLLYMLQIYYDFSGYSDIAVGLSRLLGFEIKENFNFPYISKSITEFWRRWHISLGTWFREYVYIPLGGSRVSKARSTLNVGIVFLLTGVWHGAGWNYMLWGILNGICNIIEKLIGDTVVYRKIPDSIKWLCTMIITFFAWEIFRLESIYEVIEWFKILFGHVGDANIPYTWKYYFDYQIITFVVIGTVGATVFGVPRIQQVYLDMVETKVGYIVNQLVIIVLFVLAVLFMVNSTYSPFIYFQY